MRNKNSGRLLQHALTTYCKKNYLPTWHEKCLISRHTYLSDDLSFPCIYRLGTNIILWLHRPAIHSLVWCKWKNHAQKLVIVALGRISKHELKEAIVALRFFLACNLLVQLFNNYSSSPNGLSVNSPWGRRPNGLLTQRPWGERNNCFSKIQLVGQKFRSKTTLAWKTRFIPHCFGFQSRDFSLLVGYNI